MYHLAKGIYKNITRHEEYSVLILGLDNAGKTTLLERLKVDYSLNKKQDTIKESKYSSVSRFSLSKLGLGLGSNKNKDKEEQEEQDNLEENDNVSLISSESVNNVPNTIPTIGQNVAHIRINGIWLRFWDVGGQEALRKMWSEYYNVAHAVVFVVDSTDEARIQECRDALLDVITHHDTEGIPILMLANKQDRDEAMEVEEIKEIFNKIAEHLGARDSRVLPISALKDTGITEATEWLTTRLARNKQNHPPDLRN